MIDRWDVILFLFAAVPVSLSYYFGYQYVRQLGHVADRSRKLFFGQEIKSEADQLVRLCPRPIVVKWRVRTAPVMFLVFCPLIVLPLLSFIALPNGWDVLHFEIIPGFDVLLVAASISLFIATYQSFTWFYEHQKLRFEELLVLDETGRYRTEFSRKTGTQKLIGCVMFLLWFAIIVTDINDALRNPQIEPPWFVVLMFAAVLTFTICFNLISNQTIFTNTGYYKAGSKTNWSSVEEYRWFRDCDQVVLYLHSQNARSPITLIPIPTDKIEETAAFLEQKLPGKRREDVETALEELEADNRSLHSEQTPA